MWAIGYFNLALLLAEEERYSEAILNMKKYLELQPNAPDARKAQDKIYIWEDKENSLQNEEDEDEDDQEEQKPSSHSK